MTPREPQPLWRPATSAGGRSSLRLVLLALAILSITSRFFRLARQPLWLDELYSYQLTTQSWMTLLRNSRYESHPPLYYGLLKLAMSGPGPASEYSVRWLSAVCGALTLLSFFALARRIVGTRWAVVGWALMLSSPPLLYYSQEARSYILATLLATLSAWALQQLLAGKSSRTLWSAWALLSVQGFYTAYGYLLVFAIQVVFLARAYRLDRAFCLALGGAGACMALLLPLLAANVSQDSAASAPGPVPNNCAHGPRGHRG